MSEMTYTKCNLCGGTLFIILHPRYMSTAALQEGASSEVENCPCQKSKTPGWAETGITLGQIERAVECEQVLRNLFADAALFLKKSKITSAPSASEPSDRPAS